MSYWRRLMKLPWFQPSMADVAVGGEAADRTLVPPSWFEGARLTQKQRKAVDPDLPSFADFLNFRDWDVETGAFLLADGNSAGFLWELTPVATEGRDDATIAAMHAAFSKAIRRGLIEDVDSPWICQFFVHDEPSLHPLWRAINEHIPPALRDTQLTKHYLEQVDAHLAAVAAKGGVFSVDKKPWRGKERRVFVTLYRLSLRRESLSDALQKCVEAKGVFSSALASEGVSLRPCRGRDLIEWLQPMLNPNPEIADDPFALMRMTAFPDEITRNLPPGWDLGEYALRSAPTQVSDGVWRCNDTYYTTLTVQQWTGTLGFGHLTGEDDKAITLMDQLPEGARVSMSIAGEPQYQIRAHLTNLERTAVGDSAEANNTKRDIDEARQAMSNGAKLYRIAVGVTISASSETELTQRANACAQLLTKASLSIYERRWDAFRASAFVDALPFGYSHSRDQAGPKRATLQYDYEIAKLIPVAGRARGTGSACLNYFNRGAEPLSVDPIADRIRNAHMTFFGPTGAGKSANLTYAIWQIMAVHRPYLWIIDPKWPAPSFGPVAQYFKAMGLTVNHVTLTPDADIALNPYEQAMLLLDEEYSHRTAPDDDIEGGRDLLGEMVFLTLAMITGGEQAETERLRRADKTELSEAILRAAKTVQAEGRKVVLTEDVVKALTNIAAKESNPEAQSRLMGMSKSLQFFCKGTAGRIFNRPGRAWPTVDVTLVEFATLGTEGYADQLSVAFMSLLQSIQAHITRHQYGHRNTIAVVDEVHSLAANPLMGSYISKIIKTWRSAGAWYWQATQSIDDFKGPMKPLLTQLEYMLVLSMPKDEVEKLRALKSLTNEQAQMVESATKTKHYAEGVILHERCTALFRAVLPPLVLALAQTEQNERAKRRDIMAELGCTELEAIYEVARRIAVQRAEHANVQTIKTWSDR